MPYGPRNGTAGGGETPAQRRSRLLRAHPEYCSAADVGRMLGIVSQAVRHHRSRIQHIELEGMFLFDRASAARYASTFSKANRISRTSVTGIEVERLQKICEAYYRTHYDTAPPELLKLAKRLARL